ncbi:MAG: peptidase MA family metallohydrolase, partial [Phycisphaerae bacterium]
TMCARALSINPNDLAAMGLSAGASACRYDDEATRRMAARASTINPRSAVFYRTLGDALGGIRQYEAAEQAYRRAIEYDPTDANARTELGMLYMQWGVEAKARDALQAAWALDEYNARTHFTLELLESLDAFSKHETEHFVIKYDKHRDRGLGPYVAEYLEQIYDDVTGDYATTLADKTIIELFPTHRAFGVRITGKPWIHTVGACTGRVIALASPREAPDLMGPYNFARVLLHEFTHTVTLAATDNRIPHWFTEGLAVYQEDTPRSFGWWRLLAEAARRDELFTLTSIDWGFMRPQRPTDREMAYAQSEWMCQYIVQRFGYDVINTMLHAFHERRTQAQAFTDVLGIDVDAFDKDFHTWARSELRRIGFDLTPPEDVAALRELAQAEPDNAAVHGRFARAEFDQGHAERALASARRALALDERNRHALDVLLRVLAGQAAHAASRRAQAALDDEAWPIAKRLAQIDPDAWIAHRQMGEIALRRHQLDDAVEAFQRLQRLCPLDPASWRGLAGVYLQRGDDDLALPQLLELARTEEHDADVPASIARIYTRKRRLRDAEYWYRQALYVNPFATNLHEALADVSMQLGDTAAALREYTMLTELMPDHAPYFASAAAAAHKIGDAATAATMARKAVALDPASPARALVPQP